MHSVTFHLFSETFCAVKREISSFNCQSYYSTRLSVWKTLLPAYTLCISFLEIMEYIFDIDISRADGCSQQCLLSSSSDNCLRVYDAESLEIVSTISAHKKTINNIEFSRVSPFLLYSCSSDHSLCLWDTRSPTTACFSIKVLSLNISRNKVHLLCINIMPSSNICD